MICTQCFGDGGRDVWVDNPTLDNQDWKTCERCRGSGFIEGRLSPPGRHTTSLAPSLAPLSEREPFDVRCQEMIRVAEEEMRRLES